MTPRPSTHKGTLAAFLCLFAATAIITTTAFAQPSITARRIFHPPTGTAFENEQFATSLDSHLDTIVVGIVGDDVPGSQFHGRVEVWRLDTTQPGGPTLEAVLTPSPGQVDNDLFGADVAIYRSRIIVGAPGDDSMGPNSGAAYIFERIVEGKTVTWTQTAQLLPPDAWGSFGRAVDISSSAAVVGSNSLEVSAFEKQGQSWVDISGGLEDTSSFPSSFGWDVATYGDLVAISDPGWGILDGNDEDIDVGVVHVYKRDHTSSLHHWKKTATLHSATAVNFEYMGVEIGLTAAKVGRETVFYLPANTSYGVRLWRLSSAGLSLGEGMITSSTIPDFGRHLEIEGGVLMIAGDEDSPQQRVQLRRLQPDGTWPVTAYFETTTPPDAEGWGASLAAARDFLIIGSPFATREGQANAGWASWVMD